MSTQIFQTIPAQIIETTFQIRLKLILPINAKLNQRRPRQTKLSASPHPTYPNTAVTPVTSRESYSQDTGLSSRFYAFHDQTWDPTNYAQL